LGGLSTRLLRRSSTWLALLAATSSLIAPSVASASPTIVSLEFDDTWADQHAIRSLLSEHGLRATFFVNSGFIGQSNRMSLSQVRDLASDGNEIGGHTITHADLVTLTPDQLRHQVCDDRAALLAAGFSVESFAYPYGHFNDQTKAIVRECGYNSARTVKGIVSPGQCPGCPYAESLPPADSYATRTPENVFSTTTLETLEGFVTQSEQHGGGWVQLVFHHVCDGCGTYAIKQSDLAQFLDWLVPRASIGTVVRPVGEVIGGDLKPPPAPADNLLQNASLESDHNADGTPDCWLLGGYGTNAYSWTRTADAHSGGFAERLDISSYTSGDRKLMTPLDQGACAPAAVPGRSYRVSGYFKATAPVRIVVFARDAAGAWSFWTKSAFFAASPTWTQAIWSTPAVPQGVTALSVGLALSSVGSATFDDFALASGGT
jgi:peptidoglycan/xylan/chitin deacetylase (PgdA/CDA1 family)